MSAGKHVSGLRMKSPLRCILLALTLLAYSVAASPAGNAPDEGVRVVGHVVDGDTLVLENGERVRLIGVDTPEGVDKYGRNRRTARRIGRDVKFIDAYALQAKRLVESLIQGRQVKLDTDPANESIRHRDAYGRTLAYVYRHRDGLFLNAEILRQGCGFAYTKFPFKYKDEFVALEREAKRRGAGLWAD